SRHDRRPGPIEVGLGCESVKIEGEGEDEASKEYRQRLEAKLEPWRIRATLSFAALYQIVHEQIKTAVLHEVRQFYWRGWDDDGVDLYDEATYRADVLA